MTVRDDYNGYMRAYMIKRYHTVRAAMVVQLGASCARCGSTSALEIDHVDAAAKTMEVNRMTYVSESRRQAELKNCQLLCRDCHEVKTVADVGQKRGKGQHGTLASYRYCRCAECRAAKSAYNKLYRKRRNGSVA